MTSTISISGLTRRYREHVALDDVGLEIEGLAITGLLGRNGAGKTTLLRIVAGQEFPTTGRVEVLGAGPAENDAILRRLVLVREDQVFPDIRVRDALRLAASFYPDWSGDLADAFASESELPAKRYIAALSRGMRAALGNVIGLAARAEVTLFDEPYAGLDATARRRFNDRLLADYAERPRTVVLSTHLIDEAADLLERVVLMDRGRIVLDGAADEIRGSATRVSGSTAAVETFVAGRPTWDRRAIVSQTSVVLAAKLDEADRASARALRLSLEPVSLQELIVHAAGGEVASSADASPERALA